MYFQIWKMELDESLEVEEESMSLGSKDRKEGADNSEDQGDKIEKKL